MAQFNGNIREKFIVCPVTTKTLAAMRLFPPFMKAKDYYKIKPRLQDFKKCLGCSEIYTLDKTIKECSNCGNKKFIDVTDYIREI